MHITSLLFTPVLIAGCVIVMASFAIRGSFGMFRIPIATEFGWPRADFSMAMSFQNLAWGFAAPVFSAIAEKLGDSRAMILGALCYADGLLLSSQAVTPGAYQLYEILVGFGIAGTGFRVILVVVGRASTPENQSMTLPLRPPPGRSGK